MDNMCLNLKGCVNTNYNQFANKNYILEIADWTCGEDVNYDDLSGCFENCLNLESFTFHKDCKMTKIPKRFFKNCTSLKSIDLPSTIEIIDESAFEGCDNLATITFFGESPSLKYVNDKAFKGCVTLNLENVLKPKEKTLTNGVTTKVIASEAFEGCLTLTEVDFTVEALSGITAIEAGAFANCEALSKVIFYDEDMTSSVSTLMYIGSQAFYDTSIDELKLPDNVIKIDSKAFAECSELSSVTKLNHEFPLSIGLDAFLNCKKLKTLIITGSTQTEERFLYLGEESQYDDTPNHTISYGNIMSASAISSTYVKTIKNKSISSKNLDFVSSSAFDNVNKSGAFTYNITVTDETFKEIHTKRKEIFADRLPKVWINKLG